MASADLQVVCPALIGREPALTVLDAAIEHVERPDSEDGIAVIIAGEAGIGKSRLVREVGERFRARYPDAEVLAGHCFENDRNLPYAPLLDMLREICDRHSENLPRLLGSYASELVKLLPELPGIEPSATLAPEQERSRLFHVLSQFLGGLAADRPLLIVVEDLHWSDDTSLDFLGYLARQMAGHRALLLLTHREEEISPALRGLLARLERERRSVTLALDRLTPAQVHEMLRAMLGDKRAVSGHLRDEIWSLTEGNPFFIEEVVKALVEGAGRRESSGRFSSGDARAVRIPHSVQDTVQQRLDRLRPVARQTVAVAAVAGRRFDFPLLQAVTDQDEQGLLEVVKELIDAQLVVEESADRFAFRHALTREAVYSRLLLRERRALHRRIAEEIQQPDMEPPADRLTDLAFHSYQAGMWREALEYSLRAGELAGESYDPRAAAIHLTRALDAARELGVDPPLSLFLKRGLACAALGDFDDALRDQTRALQVARAAGDRESEWQAQLNLGMLWAERDYTVAGDHYQSAHDIALEIGDDGLRAHSLNRLGNWRLNLEQPELAVEHHRDALAIFRAREDATGVAETLDLLGMASYLSGDLIAGTDHYRQAVDLFRASGNRQGLASSLATSTMRGATLQTDTMVNPGDSLDACISDGQAALETARDIGWRAGEAYALWMIGFCQGARGEYAEALRSGRSSLEIARDIEHRQWMAAAHCMLGATRHAIFDWPAAGEHFAQALELARTINSRHWTRAAAGLLASTLVQAGDGDEADALLAGLLDHLPKRTLAQRLLWCARVEADLRAGQAERALRVLDDMLADSPHAGTGVPVLRLGYLRGQALAALGRDAEAVDDLDGALDLARSQGAAGMEWRVLLGLARLHHASNDRAVALDRVEAARVIVQRLAAALDEDRLRDQFVTRAMSMLSVIPSPTSLQAAKQEYDGLTARQCEVAGLIARGYTNREIAGELSVTERTVESHVTNILSTLDFSSRSQIAVWAVEKGLTGSAD